MDTGDERWAGSPEGANAWASGKRQAIMRIVNEALRAHGGPYPLSALCVGVGGLREVNLSERTVRRHIMANAQPVPGQEPPPLEVRDIEGQSLIWFRDPPRRKARGQSAVRQQLMTIWEGGKPG